MKKLLIVLLLFTSMVFAQSENPTVLFRYATTGQYNEYNDKWEFSHGGKITTLITMTTTKLIIKSNGDSYNIYINEVLDTENEDTVSFSGLFPSGEPVTVLIHTKTDYGKMIKIMNFETKPYEMILYSEFSPQ